jgi:hypothetical protein
LSLGYDGSLGNGPLGVGWDLSVPGIRRSLRLGVPRYDATDEIDLVGLGSGGQVVASPSGELRVEGQEDAISGRLHFTYATPQAAKVQQVPGMAGWAQNQQGTSLFDVDADGAMDLFRLTTGGHSWRRHVGGQFGDPQPLAGASGAGLDRVRLVDLDGDSTGEMVWRQGSQWSVFRLDVTNQGWVAAGSLAGATGRTLSGVGLADVNGDRRIDVLSSSGSRMNLRMGPAWTGVPAPPATVRSEGPGGG